MCKDIDGVCITHRDGYYAMSALCMILGVILLVVFIIPKALKLQGEHYRGILNARGLIARVALPISVWRVKMD